ncbi:MAG: DinB family protein [Pyrinomonadaceae bacterium]
MSVSQTVSRTGGEIDGLVGELQAITEDAMKVFGNLKPAQLNWKPSAEQWSVGQCFDHLIVTNDCFIPVMVKIAAGKYRSSLWGRVSPLSGFFGRFILKALDPEKGRKTKAPRVFAPASSDVGADVIHKFVMRQWEVVTYMRATESAGVDMGRTIVTSPVSPVATYSLLDAYRIVVAHERKHFEQARRVTRAAGFPAN